MASVTTHVLIECTKLNLMVDVLFVWIKIALNVHMKEGAGNAKNLLCSMQKTQSVLENVKGSQNILIEPR